VTPFPQLLHGDSKTPHPPADITHINRMPCDKLSCSHGLPAKGDPQLDRRRLLTAQEMLPKKRRKKLIVCDDSHSQHMKEEVSPTPPIPLNTQNKGYNCKFLFLQCVTTE
jgi:hypothetical protein